MGFGNKSPLGFTTNSQTVRYVRGSCGVTGNLPCAINSLYIDTATQPLNITSVQLVANTNNMYGAPDYVYVFTLNSTSSCGFFNGEDIMFTIDGTNYTFGCTENCTSSTDDSTILVPALSPSYITTSQGNYYTINSGTYTISLNSSSSSSSSTQMSSTVTFDQVTFNNESVPSQKITVN